MFEEDWKEVYFNNDGCSSPGPLKWMARLFLNRNYACFCRDHDFDYRYGWKYEVSRSKADTYLREGITASGHPRIATLVYLAVSAIGWVFYKKRG